MPAPFPYDVRLSLRMPGWQVPATPIALISLCPLPVSTVQKESSADGWQWGPSAQHIGSCSKRVQLVEGCSKNVQDFGSCSTPRSSTFKEEMEMDNIIRSSRIDSGFGSCAGRSLRIKTQKFCDSIAESPFSLRHATTAQHRRLVLRLELR